MGECIDFIRFAVLIMLLVIFITMDLNTIVADNLSTGKCSADPCAALLSHPREKIYIVIGKGVEEEYNY